MHAWNFLFNLGKSSNGINIEKKYTLILVGIVLLLVAFAATFVSSDSSNSSFDACVEELQYADYSVVSDDWDEWSGRNYWYIKHPDWNDFFGSLERASRSEGRQTKGPIHVYVDPRNRVLWFVNEYWLDYIHL